MISRDVSTKLTNIGAVKNIRSLSVTRRDNTAPVRRAFCVRAGSFTDRGRVRARQAVSMSPPTLDLPGSSVRNFITELRVIYDEVYL